MIEIFCSKLCIADMKDVWNGFYVVGVGGGGVPSISEKSQKIPPWITYKHIFKSYLEPSLNNMYTIDTIWKSIFEQIWKKNLFFMHFPPPYFCK